MPVKDDSSIKNNVYKYIEKTISSRLPMYKKCISEFINYRSQSLFVPIPVDRIYYGSNDANKMFEAINIDKKLISQAISNTYYGEKTNFNPRAAKDEITVLLLSIIRYFLLKKDDKNLDTAMAYLAFSGKFYPSIHSGSFPILPKDYVMEFVINNMLNNKFALKSTGSIFNAVMSICKTWISTYGSRFKSFNDEDVVYLIGQLHSRIRSFMINIAKVYYQAYKNKDYIVYNSDNEEPSVNGGQYHLADSDSFKAERCIQKTMQYITNNRSDYKLCKMCSNESVSTEELRSIIESILINRENLVSIKKAISIMIYTYFANSKSKNVVSMDFITYVISPKPNTKDKNILELKDIIENWLNTSDRYRRRKRRPTTRNNYIRSIMMYFAMIIFKSNK